MPITLEGIARMSGVSRSTVSRVLNGYYNASEDTWVKVQAAIQSVGFQPNLAARNPAAARTRVLGLVIPEHIAVIGFDDIPAAALSKPPLTTVRQPAQARPLGSACFPVPELLHYFKTK